MIDVMVDVFELGGTNYNLGLFSDIVHEARVLSEG